MISVTNTDRIKQFLESASFEEQLKNPAKTPSEEQAQSKIINHILVGIEKQLKSAMDKISNLSMSPDFLNNLQAASNSVKKCQELTNVKKIIIKPLLNNLSEFIKLNEETLSIIQKLDEKILLDGQAKLEELEQIKDFFIKAKDAYSKSYERKIVVEGNIIVENCEMPLLAQAENEIKRLRGKINEYDAIPLPKEEIINAFAYRVRTNYPDYGIKNSANESNTKDNDRIDRYKVLEKAYSQALLSYDKVFYCLASKKISFSLIGVNKTHDHLVEYLQSMLQIIDKIGIENLTAGFEQSSESKKRDLSQFYDILNLSITEMQKASNFNEELRKTNDSHKNLRTIVSQQLVEVTHAVKGTEADLKSLEAKLKTLQEQDKNPTTFSATFKSDDKNLLEAQILECKLERDNLIALRNDIMKKWNESCLILHKINIDLSRFEKIINVTANFIEYSLKYEDIQGNLRDTRKHCVFRSEHEKAYNENKQSFLKLFEDITESSMSLFYQTTSLQPKDFEIQMSRIVSDHPVENLNKLRLQKQFEECIDIEKQLLELRATASEVDGKNAGLVWISEETKDLVLKELTNQRKEAADLLQKAKLDVQKTYKWLVQMCGMATQELNTMSETLATTSSDYDEKFNHAYTFKNPAGKRIAQVGGSLAQGFSGALSLFQSTPLNYTNPGPERQPHKELYSPFDPVVTKK